MSVSQYIASDVAIYPVGDLLIAVSTEVPERRKSVFPGNASMKYAFTTIWPLANAKQNGILRHYSMLLLLFAYEFVSSILAVSTRALEGAPQ